MLNDINKVFIPCRTVLEMEAIISLYLVNSNYDKIKEIPETRPSSRRLIDMLGVRDKQFYVDIIDFFINCAIPKVKPVVMYAREHHERYRMGNVAPYTKTRVCVYLALHRLKIKFLMIKSFIDEFKSNNYSIYHFFEKGDDEDFTFLVALAKDYYKKNKMNLRLMIPKRRVSKRVQNLLNDNDSITSKKLFKLATFKIILEKTNIIKFIMREIKASIFVCKLMFAKMDLHNPFSFMEETELDLEEIMISNDFIPELLNAISRSQKDFNIILIDECINAFEFFMDKVLNGINKAIEITSGGQIQIGLYETIYNTGNIFAFQRNISNISI